MDGQAGAGPRGWGGRRLGLDRDLAPGGVCPERHSDRDREPIWSHPAEHGLVARQNPSGDPRRAASGGPTVVLGRLLDVPRADLLDVRVVDQGLAREAPSGQTNTCSGRTRM